MSFDTLYMMQLLLLVTMVFGLLAYVSMIRANNLVTVGRSLSSTGIITARQFAIKLNIEDFVSFEKYGVWRYHSRYKELDVH